MTQSVTPPTSPRRKTHAKREENGGSKYRRRRPSRIIAWLVLLAVSIPCASIIYHALRARADAGVGLPDYSVYSDGRDGYAQAAELLRKLGWRPTAVTRPIQQTHHRGLLILSESDDPLAALGMGTGLSLSDTDGLLDWVAAGNTLLYFGLRDTLLHRKLGVQVHAESSPADTVYIATAGSVGQYTTRVQNIGLELPATISGRRAVPLFSLGNKPTAVAVRHGDGRVLIVADPSILTHRGLLREDNAVFLYNVAALDAVDGRVFFDEFHHGIRSSGGYWSYLQYHGQQWVVLQLLLVGGMAVWAVGRRLGPAVPTLVTSRTDGVDYAASVARIYEKADARELVAGIYALDFLDAITQHLRLRRGAEHTEILVVWKQRYGTESIHELAQLLEFTKALIRGEDLTPKQLLSIARRFDALLRQTEPRTNSIRTTSKRN